MKYTLEGLKEVMDSVDWTKVSELQRKFCEATGASRPTFYRLWKKRGNIRAAAASEHAGNDLE